MKRKLSHSPFESTHKRTKEAQRTECNHAHSSWRPSWWWTSVSMRFSTRTFSDAPSTAATTTTTATGTRQSACRQYHFYSQKLLLSGSGCLNDRLAAQGPREDFFLREVLATHDVVAELNFFALLDV